MGRGANDSQSGIFYGRTTPRKKPPTPIIFPKEEVAMDSGWFEDWEGFSGTFYWAVKSPELTGLGIDLTTVEEQKAKADKVTWPSDGIFTFLAGLTDPNQELLKASKDCQLEDAGSLEGLTGEGKIVRTSFRKRNKFGNKYASARSSYILAVEQLYGQKKGAWKYNKDEHLFLYVINNEVVGGVKAVMGD